MSFLWLSGTELSSWFHRASKNGFTAIGELDCKEQFNTTKNSAHTSADKQHLAWGKTEVEGKGPHLEYTPHELKVGQSRESSKQQLPLHYP